MTLKVNPILEFFSSVRLALLIISLLVVTSIVGTIIPQEQPIEFYLEKYGQANAIIMEIFGIYNTYTSIWFKSLLLLLCLNLVVCSLDRIPQVLKFIKKDNLNADKEKLMRSKDKIVFTSKIDAKEMEIVVHGVLEQKKWKVRSRRNSDALLFFSEKGALSRLGAYLVHVSILVIFLGALVGSYLGFKAFVMVPEGEATSEIYKQDAQQTKISLPFTLRCDAFDIEYYENGMPKEYRSDLVALENDEEAVKKRITVNDPLSFSGFTFYQSSYQPIPDQYTVELIKKNLSNEKIQEGRLLQRFYVGSRTKQVWKDTQVRFEIIETGMDGHGPYKIWFDDEMGKPVQLVVEDKKPLNIERDAVSYEIMVKQRYATGLQVVNDPGVWLVYVGFGLMLFGLYVAFFMSHRRLWVSIQKTGATSTIILSGSSNKNQAGFSKNLDGIATALLNEKSLKLRRV